MIGKITIYPYIELEYASRFLKLDDTPSEFRVWYNTDENTSIDVSSEAIVISLDNNLIIENNTIIPVIEGTATAKVIYQGCQTKIQFVVYNNFFKDNYRKHYIPAIDAREIEVNTQKRILFDTLFEFHDILYAYSMDIETLNSPLQTKAEFLAALTTAMGFPGVNYQFEDSEYEAKSMDLYRNLLDNFLDILEIRGTQAAYELFFEALGYDIEIMQFWFDDNENLVEINTTDPNASSFDTYDITGRRLAEADQTYSDPRTKVDYNNSHTKNNKSNYMRVELIKNENLPLDFNIDRNRIREYLEFLKPNNMEYLTELMTLGMSSETINLNGYNDTDISVCRSQIIGGGTVPPVVPPFKAGGKCFLQGTAMISSFVFQLEGEGGAVLLGAGQCRYTPGNVSVDPLPSVGNYVGTGKLLAGNNAISKTYLKNYDPRMYGQQVQGVWDWRRSLTDENRANLETGWVETSRVVKPDGSIAWVQSPADFFAKDFNAASLIDRQKSYNSEIYCIPGLVVEDDIQIMSAYDSNTQYDADELYGTGLPFRYDKIVFFGDSFMKPRSFRNGVINNAFIVAKESSPMKVGENQAVYDERIKSMVIAELNTTPALILFCESLKNVYKKEVDETVEDYDKRIKIFGLCYYGERFDGYILPPNDVEVKNGELSFIPR